MVVRLKETRTPVAKFVCHKWPKLRIRNLQFVDGELSVYSDNDAALVRIAHGFPSEIHEVPVNAPTAPAPELVQAHQGMMTSKRGQAIPAAPKPEPVVEESDADEVISKGGGWYEYQGQSYRKVDLPPEAQELLG